MKTLISLFLSSICVLVIQAQNPYESIGIKDVQVLTLSNGKYNEFFTNDTLVQIGSALLNTQTKKIVSFIEQDSLETTSSFEPQLVSRWMTSDPHAEKYYEWSPYNYCYNNPIIYIDPDGRDGRLSVEENEEDKVNNVTYETTVWVYGNNEQANKTAADANGHFQQLKEDGQTSYSYVDDDGVTWNVSLNVEYKVTEDISSDTKVADLSSDAMASISGFQDGDNVISASEPPPAGTIESMITDNTAVAGLKGTQVHATMHMLGFPDTYGSTPVSGKDVMDGPKGTTISPQHYKNFVNGYKSWKDVYSFTGRLKQDGNKSSVVIRASEGLGYPNR
jgi:hypothetical protein